MIKYNRKLNIATRGLNKAFPNERTKKQINLVRAARSIGYYDYMDYTIHRALRYFIDD